MELRRRRLLFTSSAATLFFFVLTACSAYGADQETLDRLEAVIRQQQAHIQAQQQALEQLQDEVQNLKGQAHSTQAETAQGPVAVKPGNPKAELKLYGQINKAVLYSNDGNTDDVYLVDNDNSSTRIGALGSIRPGDKYEIGTLIEVEYQTNPSNLVNQEEERISSTGFEKRHLDLWVKSQTFGKISLGWGSTASDGTSEMDLSGTSVVGYSNVEGMAGGQLFFDENTNLPSGITIGSVTNNMDGLSRDERIRYDSPSFSGFTGSASYISKGGGDAAVRYRGQIETFKLAAAVAYSNPGGTSGMIDDTFNGSISALHDSGFSGTVAMGTRNNKGDGRDRSAFFYAKLGYQANWIQLGTTFLSVDFGRFSDIRVNGDTADVYGFQLVQDFRTWGTEAYLGYRLHKLDRDGEDYDNINAVMAGMRVKF